jgi:hypothetical protein
MPLKCKTRAATPVPRRRSREGPVRPIVARWHRDHPQRRRWSASADGGQAEPSVTKPSAPVLSTRLAAVLFAGAVAWIPDVGLGQATIGAAPGGSPRSLEAQACADAAGPFFPAPQALAEGLWWWPAATGDATPANAGFVTPVILARGDAGTGWLVGSGPTPAFGAALGCEIAARTSMAVTDVVNLRAHPEGVMGNTAFPAARLWALEAVADAMRERCPDCVARLRERLGPAGVTLGPGSIRVPDQRLHGERGTL